MNSQEFKKLDYVSRKKIVAAWAIATLDDAAVRQKLVNFMTLAYDRESFLFHQQELAYLKAVHNSQNVETHKVTLAQKE